MDRDAEIVKVCFSYPMGDAGKWEMSWDIAASLWS